MRIRYIYSACVSIETPDCTVLCDPWFMPAYDGAWVQWPRIEQPLDVCGPSDYVYISHVHPDHYDPQFLEQYLKRYPQAMVLIATQDPPLLERKLRSRGIEPIVISVAIGLSVGSTTFWALANRANPGMNIDSALVVSDGRHSVVNFNDNPFDQAQIAAAKLLCPGLKPTIALLPFVGAGPWPQCYDMSLDEQMEAATQKKLQYLNLFHRYCDALQPTIAVPFAGQYWLHGPQLDLNPLRGMADATECEAYATCPVWVPQDGGASYIECDATGLRWNNRRGMPYDWNEVRKTLQYPSGKLTDAGWSLEEHSYRYEQEIHVPVERLPLFKLLSSALLNAFPIFKESRLLHVAIKTQLPSWWVLQTNSTVVIECGDDYVQTLTPRYEVFLDARHLFGMLTRLYNANSVRIGSLCRFNVAPKAFDRELYDLFGDFWDSLRV